MRNMLFVIVALATLIFVGNVMAATPTSHEAPSVLVESPSDVPSVSAVKHATGAQTMVNTEMEAPVVYEGPIVHSQAQPIPSYQGHQHSYHRHQPPKQQNVFDKLMELERKKNAWLKKTFLGR